MPKNDKQPADKIPLAGVARMCALSQEQLALEVLQSQIPFQRIDGVIYFDASIPAKIRAMRNERALKAMNSNNLY